jgi:hypothetical protein
VSHRPLVLVSGLTLGDYLLWNWSLSGNHDVLALVSGLTMPPLAIALLWLGMVSLARLVARLSGRSPVPAHPRARAERDRTDRTDRPRTDADLPDEVSASAATSSPPSSGKLAA